MSQVRPVGRRDGLVFTLVVAGVACLCALPMALVVLVSGAPNVIALAVLLAAVPVGPLVAAYLWLDRYEPEPRSMLAVGLGWGAFVATLVALVLGGVGQWLVPVSATQSLAVVAPVTEEASKGLFLLLLLWWRRQELDGILDGIVYAGMVGIGFAFVENILYLAAAYTGNGGAGPGGTDAVTATFVVRCLFSPFAHPLFTAFTGIGVGIAITTRSAVWRWVAPICGYLLAVLAHATWNASTLRGFSGFVSTYVILMVPAALLMTALAIWARSGERRILQLALDDAARRGLLPAEDVEWVASLRARREARRHARAAGPGTLEAMKRYQSAAIELGFLHHRYLRGTAPRDFSSRGQTFVTQLQADRPLISFPGKAVYS